VLCCIGTSCAECGIEYCSGWYDYWYDVGHCRTLGAVDWSTTMILSVIPFTEFGGSFYRLGISFEGVFQLVHLLFTIIGIIAYHEVKNNKNSEITGLSIWTIIIFVILDVTKILVDFNTASSHEIVIQIFLVIISFFISWCCGMANDNKKTACSAGALGLTVSL